MSEQKKPKKSDVGKFGHKMASEEPSKEYTFHTTAKQRREAAKIRREALG